MSSNNAIIISPEGLEIANSYLALTSYDLVAKELGISKAQVIEHINKPEVKRYINSVYLDTGYRNKHRIADLLDEMIQSKLEEARESEFYTKKDLAELIKMAHDMRMSEQKLELTRESQQTNIRTQTNVQINADSSLAGNIGRIVEHLTPKVKED